MENQEKVRSVVETFANGTPLHEEVDVGEGLSFLFDNPFEEDLEEDLVYGILQIQESKYPYFDPEEDHLYDISKFEDVDVHLLRILNDVFEDVSNSQYSGTEDGFHNYYYQLYLDN
jgi:hypothetical protein